MASSISSRQPDEDIAQRKEMTRKRDQPWPISLQAGMQPPGRYLISNHYGLRPEREGLHFVLQLRNSIWSKSCHLIANQATTGADRAILSAPLFLTFAGSGCLCLWPVFAIINPLVSHPCYQSCIPNLTTVISQDMFPQRDVKRLLRFRQPINFLGHFSQKPLF